MTELDKNEIETTLINYCESNRQFSNSIGWQYERLWMEIDTYIKGGGKRLRPRLFLLTHKLYGGKTNKAILAAACAWELLHASLLIHDDIIDRDLIRHGKKNIAGRYQEIYSNVSDTEKAHYALSAALLAGDLLLSSAYNIVLESDLNSALKLQMQSFLHEAIVTVAGGELIDTESALYPIGTTDPLAVARYKTASYSFEYPMVSGAALSGAPDTDLRQLRHIGEHIGIAYQLKDDLLGVFGDSAATGKSNRSDLIEKKRTLLIQHTLKGAPAELGMRLQELFDKQETLSESEADEVLSIINNSGAKADIESLVELHSRHALDAIAGLTIAENKKSELIELVQRLIYRHS